MSESANTRKFCRSLEAQGAMTYPLVGSRYGPAGWPDRYVSHPSWHGFIEFKGFTGKTTKLQQRIHDELQQRGDQVVVVRFSEDCTCIRIEYRVPYFGEDPDHPKFIDNETGWMNWGAFLARVAELT